MNEIVRLIFLVIMSYGIVTIVVYGSIFEGLRNFLVRKSNFFGSLITCVLCTSTWVGFFSSYLVGGVSDELFGLDLFLTTFMDGMFIAGSVWAINSIIEFFEENRIK